MRKRVFYNLLKAKGYKVTAKYNLDEDGNFWVKVRADLFIFNDNWKCVANSIDIMWYNDELIYCSHWYNNDITKEENMKSYWTHDVDDMEETLLDMICNL